MLANYYGELTALLTAIFWTITALAFEIAAKKVGTYSLNIIRLGVAFILLAGLSYFRRGMLWPVDANIHAWTWLSLSGIIGFVLGDLFLFNAFAMIGSRISMLIMTLVPPITALIGWLLLGETMNLQSLGGMFLVIAGIALTIWSKQNGKEKLTLNYPLKGIFFAFLGAVGQAGGLVLSKFGMRDYDPFAATHIRIIAGFLGFAIVISFLGRWKFVKATFSDKIAMRGIGIGSFFGPFLGVSFSLVAIQHTKAGIAATLMAIVPVLIIPPAIFIFKQKVSWKEVIGAIVSVIGVALFFI